MNNYIDEIIERLSLVISHLNGILLYNIDEHTIDRLGSAIYEINSFRSRNNNWIIHFDGLDERLYILSHKLEEIVCGKWDYKNDSHQDSIRELLIHTKEYAIHIRQEYESYQQEKEKTISLSDIII